MISHVHTHTHVHTHRLKTFEHQNERTASREYQIGKLDSLKTQVDEVSRKFEVCQDAYATAMFNFLSKEHLYTEKIQQMVKQQLSLHKQAVASLEAMLPQFDKKRGENGEQLAVASLTLATLCL